MHNFHPILPESIQSAMIRLIKLHPYFDVALYSIQFIETDHPDIKGTMGVDKQWRCYYDKQAVSSWSPKCITTVLIHELWHLLREHCHRVPINLPPKMSAQIKGKDISPIQVQKLIHDLWNIATDCEINDDLTASIYEFPFPPNFPKNHNLSDNEIAEFYYSKLDIPIKFCSHASPGAGKEQSEPELNTNTDHFQSSCVDNNPRQFEANSECSNAPGVSQIEKELIIKETAKKIIQASKSQGDIPEGALRWAKKALKPVVNWRRMLQAFFRQSLIRSSGMMDFTYSRPNRRASIHKPLVFPGRCKYTPNVLLCTDTSGSMSDDMLGQALAEVDSLIKNLENTHIEFISCDAACSKVQKILNTDQVKMYGGGGTDMTLAMVEMAKYKPDVAILITDGYTNYPSKNPFTPKTSLITLVLCTNGAKPSFGKVIVAEEG